MFCKRLSVFIFTFLCGLHLKSASIKSYGAQSMISPLRKVLVKRPDKAFVVNDPQKWHYTSIPDLKIAQQEHDDFVKILTDYGVEIFYHDEFLPKLADAIFVHDPVLVTDQGAIILRMGKVLRADEPDAIARCLECMGVPILYRLNGQATVEGGDCLWLDEKTLAVGRGFRTNDDGIKQLTEVLKKIGIDLLPVQMPFFQGPEACLHLQSLISIVDEKVAVVYKSLLPVSFVQILQERGVRLIDVSDEEFLTMGSNLLAIKPGVVLTIEGNPVTKKRLENTGIKVLVYNGNEISHKAEGGATCLTRPLLRF